MKVRNDLIAPPKSVKGRRGFIRSKVKRDNVLGIRVTDDQREFIQSYCQIYGISMTELFLQGLQCLTRFDGTNKRQVLSDAKKGMIRIDQDI